MIFGRKEEILETFDLEMRVQKVTEKLTRQIEVLELSRKIGSEAKDAMDRSQCEYFLREQLKAIHKELGDAEGKTLETHELRKKIQSAKMPPEVEQEALKEVARFERLPEGPRNIRWFEPIWTGWSNFPGVSPPKRPAKTSLYW
jgi:ATP-dependent Lon protease